VTVKVLLGDALAGGVVVRRGGPEAPEVAAPMAGIIDEQLFLQLYRRTAPALRAYAARVLGNMADADDIVQESYLRFMRSPPATGDPQQVRAFLFRIASHIMVDHWRRQRRERARTDERVIVEGSPGPDLPLRLDMARVFGQLRAQERQLLWLAYVEGADHREIAAALGLRERSVRVLLYRARHKLARLLRESGRAC
jgi:RNA polymerase sigma-70 factor (ECF subfamily)